MKTSGGGPRLTAAEAVRLLMNDKLAGLGYRYRLATPPEWQTASCRMDG